MPKPGGTRICRPSLSCVAGSISTTPKRVNMKLQLTLAVCCALAAAVGSGAPATVEAQMPDTFTVYASGLNAPRGLTFGSDGWLYVAEGGTGGTVSTAGQCE